MHSVPLRGGYPRLTNPALSIAATASNIIALGVLWLMVTKPGWTHSSVVVVVVGVIGGVVGSALARRDGGPGRARLHTSLETPRAGARHPLRLTLGKKGVQ